MASDGDGKGRVATAPGAGYGYGYGGYEGLEDRKWWPWLVPTLIVACIAVFVVEMYENNCPKNRSQLGGCVAGFLRRFSFQPLRENPLLGPSSSTTCAEITLPGVSCLAVLACMLIFYCKIYGMIVFSQSRKRFARILIKKESLNTSGVLTRFNDESKKSTPYN